ncbi:MAG: TlpA family protein disulfide reductase [Bacteroidetes bacterium]|nr:TlpA family protein disulfide reductase [Bacteroidota bacterium]
MFFTLPRVPVGAQSLPEPTRLLAQDGIRVPIYEGFEQLHPLFTHETDTLRVINFWATWCAPCVEELPYFDELAREQREQPVQVILISLDFRKQLEKRLLPFLRERDLQATVVVLDDPDADSWIDAVDPSWSGAIPATLLLHGTRREFREQTFTREELHTLVESMMEEYP